MNYLELDSSDEDKSDENALSDDQDREEVAEALADARSMIGALERGKSMKEDEDETIKEKQEDSSFIQTSTMTQVDFHDGDSLSSQASSVLPEVTAASSEVASLRTPQDTLFQQKSDKRTGEQERKRTRKRKLPGLIQKWRHFLPCRMSKCFTMMPA